MKLKDGIYDVLKWLALVVLPAAAMFYSSLAEAWGWAYAEQITQTIVALQLFLGAIIGVSTATYYADKSKSISYEEEQPEIEYDAIYKGE